jgi:hypothetical protein
MKGSSGVIQRAAAADTETFAANGYRFAKWHGKPNSENGQ